MSEEARAKVETILQEAGVTFSAIYLGEQKTGFDKSTPWQCDKYSCALTKGNGREAHEEFDFYMGIGNRKVPQKGSSYLSYRQELSYIKGCGPAEKRRRMAALNKQYAKPVAPHPADLLYSLISDSSAAEQTFANWCSDFGYDTDSRKALQTYEACQENTDKFRRVFTRAQIEALAEALQDY